MVGLFSGLIPQATQAKSQAEEKLMWLSGHPQGAIEIL
jgi:hypothetical protein